MKNLVFLIVIAICLGFLTSGCSGGSGEKAVSSATPTTANKESTKEGSNDDAISFAVKTVHLQGTAPTSAGVSVTVDDKAAQIQPGGQWEIEIPAPTSASIVQIRYDGPGLPSTEEFVMIQP